MLRILIIISLFICPKLIFSQQFKEGQLIGSKGFSYGNKARTLYYNNDKFPDILAYPFVHINNGDGVRQETIQFAMAENMETLEVADFNKDGLDDIVVQYKDGEIKIFMNSRKGLKELEQKSKIYYYAVEYSKIHVADINGDNHLDFVINRFEYVMAYTGDGTGQFQQFKTFKDLFGSFNFLMSRDIDGDGVEEIISDYDIGDRFLSKKAVKIRTYRNGFYTEKSRYNLETGVEAFYIEDMDNDGDLDFIYFDEYKNNIHWNERDANGHYHQIHTIKTAVQPKLVVLSDLDGDKDLDIVKMTKGSPDYPTQHYWIENLDNGNFSEEKPMIFQNIPLHLIVDDFNGDQIGDIAAFSTANGFRISVGINKNLNFDYKEDWVLTGGVDGFDFIDINNDGIKDIIVASRHRLFYYPVSKKGKISKAIPIAQNEFYFNKIILADMDNDGLEDVFWWDERTKINRVGWYKNLGMGKFAAQEVSLVSTRVVNASVIDFDNDGDIDIVTYEIGKVDGQRRCGLYVYQNDNGTFNTPRIAVSESEKFRQLMVFDADLDGKQDIIDFHTCECYSYSDDNQIRTIKIPFLEECYGFHYNLFMADIDNDNIDDIVMDERYKLNWFKTDSKKRTQPMQIIEESPKIEYKVNTGDIDNDGDIDILYRTSDYVMVDADGFMSKYKIMWLENDGNGNFTSHFIGRSSRRSYTIMLHDIDGDGDLDMFQPHRKWNNYGLFMYENTQKN